MTDNRPLADKWRADALDRDRRYPVKKPIEWGLWIDDPWRLVRTDEYWGKLLAHGVRTADLMVDTSALEWDPIFTHEMVKLFCTLAIEYDIEPVALGWPAPRRQVIEQMLWDFEHYAQMGVAALGIDTEHLWRTQYLGTEFRALRSAGECLLEGLQRIRERHDVRIEITTHTGHREATARATLTPHVDRLYLQAYTTRHDWRGDEVDFDGRYGPGRRQAAAIKRIREQIPAIRDGDVQLCIGHALWDQKWPGHEVDEVLDGAYDGAVSSGITSFRGWSSKWLVGVMSNSKRQQEVAAWVKGQFGW